MIDRTVNIKVDYSMSCGIPSTVGPYKVICIIGKGAFSTVYQGFDKRNNKFVALKFVDRSILNDKGVLQKVEREIRIAERVSHRNIVKFYNVFFLDSFIVLVMECLGNGIITEFKEGSLFPIDTPTYIKWGREILEGLDYLHQKGISHHDIKPENIGFNDFMEAKIMDLGLCEEFTDYCYDKSGTELFSAPELFNCNKYDGVKADIWAFGVTFHYLVTGFFPFKSIKQINNSNGKDAFKNNIINLCQGQLKEIVDAALTINPKKRPSARELLNISAFKQDIDIFSTSSLCKKNISKTPVKPKSMKNIIVLPLAGQPKLSKRISATSFYKKISI